ncbi:GNAT family N-acetyltransferase [Bacillus sp. 2205SS5-2]|uniref:GNAT family N-acetyltransferase n=1 Tax=Bacillus sp. 2205SS5-2 TaxID=3109031 RepID=UPI0030070398
MMELSLKNGKLYIVREFKENDFDSIHNLNVEEEWSNLVKNKEDTKQAWIHSNIAFLVFDNNNLVGYLRGFTDENVTTFICELLVNKRYRGQGIGKELIKFVHNLYPKTRIDLLATKSSSSFYEENHYRAFYGYRKSIEEY